MIPSFINQTIMQLKNTSLVSVVAVGDLLYQGTVITASSYRPLEVYTTIAVLYFVVLFPLTLVADRVELQIGSASMSALIADNIHKAFGDHEVLKGVSLASRAARSSP